MEDLSLFFEKLLNGIERTINLVGGILSILAFWEINSKKLKLFNQLVKRIFKILAYKLKKNIILKNRKIKRILYRQFSKPIDDYVINQVASLFTVVFLFGILFLIPVINIEKENNRELIVNQSEFDAIFYNNDMKYVASSNINNQSSKKTIEQSLRDRYPKINNNDLKSLFDSLFYTNENDLDEIVKNETDVLNHSCIENAPLDEAVTSQNKNSNYYSEIEKEFTNNKNKSLSLDLLDEIINGREELFNKYPNDKLAWLLANSYQMYAYNYLKQTDDANSILYLYMQSIYYAKKSIEFDIAPETKKTRIRYIQMRYQDIGACKSFDENVRLRAYEIYNAMDNAFNTLDIVD